MACNSAASSSIAVSRSLTGARPSRSGCAGMGCLSCDTAVTPASIAVEPGASARPGRHPALDGLHQQPADVEIELAVQLADAGGTGDVDLGDKAANHVQAGEQHSGRAQCRADLGAQPAVALVERPADAGGAGSEIAAIVERVRDARQRIRYRLAIDQQH